jgi:hypothetical protein
MYGRDESYARLLGATQDTLLHAYTLFLFNISTQQPSNTATLE